ncbi:MAG: sugar ABC transporter permease [Actinomycetota bacterium]|nr:sugar ABC transporter permease [Actinomycetota bacterium]
MYKEESFFSKIKTYLIFAGPATFIFFTVIICSFVFGIYLTFTDWDGISSSYNFIGIKNYITFINSKAFWTSFILTMKYVFAMVILTNVIAFFLAYFLTSGIKGENFFRAGFFSSNLIGGIILGIIWNFIFSNVLVYIGKNFLPFIPLFTKSWLGDPNKALWALVLTTVWQYSGYMMIIYIAGFMSIPRDVLEAATIDGAGNFVKLKNIIIPFMIPSFVVCIFLSLQRGFIVYDINLSLTGGGPFKSTQLIAMHVYEKAFLAQQYGVGQAEAFFLFVVVAIITMTQVYIGKKMEIEL